MQRQSKHQGPGRPPGTKKRDSRTVRVYLRLTPAEKLELERRAAKRKMSVSEYLLTGALSGKDD